MKKVLIIFVFTFAAVPATAQTDLSRILKLASENNPSLQEAELGIEQAQKNVESQEALYPWTLNANTGFRFDEQPTEDAIQSGVRTSTAYTGSVEVLKQFTWGSRLSLRFDLNRTTAKIPVNIPQFNVSQIQEIGPNYGSGFTATVNQPLLRGFGTSLYSIPVRGARQQKSVAELQALRAKQDVVASVYNAYWNWVRASWEFDDANEQLSRAEYYKEITEAQIQAGTVAALQREIVLQRTLAAEQAILVTKSNLADRYDDLLKAIGVAPGTDLKITAPETVPLPENQPTLQSSIASAFERSPDIALLSAETQGAELTVEQSEDATKPTLDGVVTLSQLGLSTDIDESLAQVATFDFTTFFIGLNFSMPLGNKNARYKLEADRINVRRAEVRRAIAEREIREQVKKAFQLVSLQTDRRGLSEQEIALAKTNLDAMREKYEAGRASYSEMRDLETELQNAELRDRQSKADLMLALIALARLDGTLLQIFRTSAK